MFKYYPSEVKHAINVLWNYSHDAYESSRTKKELSKEGYECQGKKAMMHVFILPYPEAKKEQESEKRR